MPILHDGAYLNLETCVHVEIFTIVGNQIWVNHHGHAVFPLPNTPYTTITNEANLSYDNDIDGEGGAEDANPDPHPRDETPGPRPLLLHAGVHPDEAGPFTTTGSEKIPLRQFLSDEFGRLHLRLDYMSEQYS